MANKTQREIYELLTGSAMSYHPTLAGVLGSHQAALILSQLLYWHGKGARGEWTYKTVRDLQFEVGLTKNEQRTAINKLVNAGIVRVELKQIPATRHFKINLPVLREAIEQWVRKRNAVGENTYDYMDTFNASITEITHETTSKNTSLNTPIKFVPSDERRERRGEGKDFEKIFPP